MGLKGYMLWVMGQLDSNVQSPTVTPSSPGCSGTKLGFFLKKQTLKPVLHL
jgi:hypothetical protein